MVSDRVPSRTVIVGECTSFLRGTTGTRLGRVQVIQARLTSEPPILETCSEQTDLSR